ncbi:hypothetical protein B1808_12120 [Pseudofulvimonas gallinarii]|nr:hypothetical protein B1808_12120 [Pseudofulvimonas gallinarii]
MAEPFMDFAKAYVRYSFSHKPVKSLAVTGHALRCIEAALQSTPGPAEVGKLNVALMDVCASKCREYFSSEDVKYQTGRALQRIFDFLREKRLVPSLPAWKSPFKKPVILTEHLGDAGRIYREEKLPSNEAMLALADVFAQADDVETRYFSSILVLLMATPSRISEVIGLPTDCLQWEDDQSGVPQMYLRWRAAKGGGVMKKWVVPVMQDAVQEAVRRLIEIGKPARDAARFAFDNPDKFLSHSNCLANPDQIGDRPLTPNELCAAVGLKPPKNGGRLLDGSLSWCQVKADERIQPLIATGSVSYSDLAKVVLNTYAGDCWPCIDNRGLVKTWEALCLHRENEFHKEFSVKPFSWTLPNANRVNERLSPARGMSLLDRYGFQNTDGTSFKLTTHQIRHWLSTMCERAGMDDYTLAQWAGRARSADNRHYDHRSPEEQLEEAKHLLPFEPAPLLERIQHRQPVSYQELGVDRLGTAKATLYGMCVHDYAMAPCQKERECMTCQEHVCIKGDHVSLDRICLLEAQTQLLLEKAQKAREEGDFGADRWVDNHKWKLAHVRAMRMALEHPQVSDGSILRIPEGHDPSPVLRALIELGVVETPSLQAINPKVIPSKLA